MENPFESPAAQHVDACIAALGDGTATVQQYMDTLDCALLLCSGVNEKGEIGASVAASGAMQCLVNIVIRKKHVQRFFAEPDEVLTLRAMANVAVDFWNRHTHELLLEHWERLNATKQNAYGDVVARRLKKANEE